MNKLYSKTFSNYTKLAIAILSFLAIVVLQPFGASSENNMAAIAVLMALLWITEAIPLSVTSLLPLLLFPIFEILTPKAVSKEFINSTIFLFLGGFLVAKAIEKNGLHKRIALSVILLFGGSIKSILTGFIVACWLMSMFITNTATTIMMLPIALSVISGLEENFNKEIIKPFSIALLLGIAYSATLGGIATLVGTVPNLVFKGIYEDAFPEAAEISFASWMAYGVPLSLIMVLVLLLLFNLLFRFDKKIKLEKGFIKNQLKALGRITKAEKLVLAIVVITSLLWIFRKSIQIGDFTFPGWSLLLPKNLIIEDSTIAIFMAVLLFLLPSNSNRRLLTNKEVKNLPWDILLLFGGGFALAKGFQVSGLSELIGSYFSGFKGINPYIFSFLISIVIIFLTELTSNTATVNTFLPILASISITLEINPLILMLPATLAASFAFMLPVATPPNAIIFSSNKLTISQMMKAGLWLNLIASIVIPASFYLLGRYIFGV